MRRRAGVQRSRREYVLSTCLTLGFTLPVQIPGFFGFWGELFVTLAIVPMYVYLVRTWRYFWWASGARVFWTLVGCTVAGGLLGTLVLLPLWRVFGLPVA